jgi:HAD superfamily hydrolase (TIGR01662 family)
MSTKHYKLIIFDLDGTLTPERTSSAAPFERRLLPGVKEKCRDWTKKDIVFGIATNQRQLRDGGAEMGRLREHISWVRKHLNIMYLSIADDARMKPHPAMLYEIMHEAFYGARNTLMVGDSASDQEAAIAAGVDFAWAKDFFGWKTMGCGHDVSKVVSSDEGTCYCSECEKEAREG